MNWLPIETAPKDGTKVDLWLVLDHPGLKPYRCCDCMFLNGRWCDSVGVNNPGGWPVYGTPTHWMPSPEAPGFGLCQICGAPEPCHCDEMEGLG